MELVYNFVLIVHFIGLALLIGAFLVQVSAAEKTVTRWMWDGALTQIVTGVILVGMASAGVLAGEKPNNAVVGIKLIIALVIAVLAFIGKKKPAPQNNLWAVIGVLAILNVCIAVLAGVMVDA